MFAQFIFKRVCNYRQVCGQVALLSCGALLKCHTTYSTLGIVCQFFNVAIMAKKIRHIFLRQRTHFAIRSGVFGFGVLSIGSIELVQLRGRKTCKKKLFVYFHHIGFTVKLSTSSCLVILLRTYKGSFCDFNFIFKLCVCIRYDWCCC